jgi:hypothetical protein
MTLAASLALVTLLGATQDLAAQNKKRAVGIDLGPIRIEIGNPGRWQPGPGPQPPRPPRPNPNLVYVVTEYNPITGGVYNSQSFNNRSDAYAYRDAVARVHWVKWRFVGINEPLRSRRFQTSFAAQRFIDSDGPSRSAALGVAILTGETRVVPTRVNISSRLLER